MNEPVNTISSKKRIEWLDFTRVIAIFCVIVCHCAESVYRYNLTDLPALSLQSRFFAVSAFTFGRLGVPLFLMVSGYLMLGREYDNDKCSRFWKENWLHLLIVTQIWIVLYHIFLCWLYRRSLDVGGLLKQVLFLQPVGMSHTWYMPMILGMYILFPVLANGLHSIKTEKLLLPFVVFAVFIFGIPTVNVILHTIGEESLATQFSTGFSGGAYGLYLMFGYFVKRGVFRKIKSGVLLIFALLSFATTIGLQLFAYRFGYKYNVWYDCAMLAVCAFCAFELFSRIRKIPLSGFVIWLSQYSFAVYLIHNIVRMTAQTHLNQIVCARPIKVMVLCAIVTAGSILIAVVIRYIPKVGKYLLYMK